MARTPNPVKNLTLGRGIPYFNLYNPDTGLYEGFRDLGEAQDLTANVSAEQLAFYTTRAGVKGISHEVTKQQGLKFTLTLIEPNDDNMGLAFMAKKETITQAAATDQELIIAKPVHDRYYITGKKGITNVDVVLTSTPATIYVEGTDYTIDSVYGRIYITPNSSIVEGTSITVTYDAEAGSYVRLNALKNPRVEGQFHFISDNASGEDYDMLAWRVSISPSGDMGFMTDDWLSLKYDLTVMKDIVNHPDNPYLIIDSLITA